MHVICPSNEKQSSDCSDHACSAAGFSRNVILKEHAASFRRIVCNAQATWPHYPPNMQTNGTRKRLPARLSEIVRISKLDSSCVRHGTSHVVHMMRRP